ncbi:MAG TPA: DUF5069 domain-containing protein [Chthoniobacterales bacterium]|jgi:hypothetical protein
MTTIAKDLTKEAPRSPRLRLGGYAIIARTIDKGHAHLAGATGDYHYDCPLDNYLFGFKGVTGDAFKEQLAAGATDEELVAWLDAHGTPKTAEEIKAWSDSVEAANPAKDPEKRRWFQGELAKLNLDLENTTLFDWLEADDKATFAK